VQYVTSDGIHPAEGCLEIIGKTERRLGMQRLEISGHDPIGGEEGMFIDQEI
jgi:hypothetical protein